MKTVVTLMLMGFLFSCSTKKENQSLEQRIQAEEVRSLQEIKSHSDFLLETHSELDEKTKNEVKSLLFETISKQEALREEESKIFQLLLKESLRVDQLTSQELADKREVKKRLKEVYEKKSKNVLSLINKITLLADNHSFNESFKKDMIQLIREMR